MRLPLEPQLCRALVFAYGWLLLAPLLAFAHGPFDNSVHASRRLDSIEFSIVMGGDAARTFLAKAAPDHVNALQGMGSKKLPTALASKICTVGDGQSPLEATDLSVAGDGLEFTFAITYPKHATATLTFRALYFESLPQMKLGTFVLSSESGATLGSGLLTEGSSIVELALPLTENENTRVHTAAAPQAAETPTPGDVGTRPAIAPPHVSLAQFFVLGLEHILTGYDHLLFLLALIVACERIKPMIAIVTCFTLAHSITLALAVLDVVNIPGRIIEPLIAASIVFVGIENMLRKPELKLRCAVTLGFGLIHGFGFAGALRESGVAGHGAQMFGSLLTFNLGIEAGQLAVAAVVLPLLLLARKKQFVARFATPAVSAIVVSLGGVWLVQRLFQ